MNPTLPTEGYVRLPQILKAIPVSRTTWWRGVKAGKYPAPVKHGRCRFWPVGSIRDLIDEISQEDQKDV